MQFQIKNLKQLLYSIQKNNIDEIHIYSKTLKLSVNRSSHLLNNTKNTIKTIENTYHPKIKKKNHKKQIQENTNTINSPETYYTIVSPMVGTFYCSPAPNEPPFIKLHDIVKKQQTVCIIEAMKLMNEIESEIYGEIVEILVKDGEIIDCGQALIRVKPINTT
uniref:acetyl-CoA carboxylase, biotin carboxyl carrier protein n=1 Tax=Hypnea pseudomusciformis TaxID=1545697 RepID=UPI0027DA2229|nr:acetyl-CoA carboxylase, biotin carboxyl carrier protein [Hypnea pseudomusciformis]WCH55158.1 acetyl-CoA carboxylase, biotin carboxyl carrier protein [Hypnea pseudomusciformis]WCH56751.1 acetyl-CoA carboxylase, biotin carboxyl carrier protein [Hypnea pseudomusciformis]